MRQFRVKRILLLILFFTTPTFMILSTVITGVNADSTIPESHPDNSWEWSVIEGDILWFEFEVVNKKCK